MFPPFLSSALLLYIQCLETSGRLVFICICWEFWKSWDASQGCGGREVPCVSQSSGATRSRRGGWVGGRRAGWGWGCLGPQPSLRDHFGGWRDWTWRGRLPDPYVSVFFEDS